MSVATKQKWGNRIGALGALVTFIVNGLAVVEVLDLAGSTLGGLNILVIGAAGSLYTIWTGERAPTPE